MFEFACCVRLQTSASSVRLQTIPPCGIVCGRLCHRYSYHWSLLCLEIWMNFMACHPSNRMLLFYISSRQCRWGRQILLIIIRSLVIRGVAVLRCACARCICVHVFIVICISLWWPAFVAPSEVESSVFFRDDACVVYLLPHPPNTSCYLRSFVRVFLSSWRKKRRRQKE